MVIAALVVRASVVAGLLAGGENDPVSMATTVVTGLPVLAAVVAGLAVLAAVVAGLAVLAAVVAGLAVLAAVVPDLGVMRGNGSGICCRAEGDRSHGSGGESDGSE
jgi:hypothetical protein